MQKTVLFLILLLGVSALPAQTSYSLQFQNEQDEWVNDLIETGGQKMIAVGGSGNSSEPYNTKGKIWQFSSPADTLTKTYFYGDTVFSFYRIFELPGPEYLVFGMAGLPPDYRYRNDAFVLLRLDASLNELWHRIIRLEDYQYSHFCHFEQCGSSFYAFGSVSENGFDPVHPCNLRFNTTGEILNCYVSEENVPSAYHVDNCLADPDAGRLYVFTDLVSGIIVYDTALNLIGRKRFPDVYNPYTFRPEIRYEDFVTARWITDSTFVVTCRHYRELDNGLIKDNYQGFSELDTTFSLAPITYIGRIPQAGEPDTIDTPAFRKSFDFRTPDSLFFTGNHNIFWTNTQRPSFITAGLLNRALELQYVCYYGGDAHYEVMGMVCTSDGGFVIAANRYDNQTPNNDADVLFLKLNPEGRIVSTPKPDLCPESIFSLYPNPASEAFTLLLAPPKAEMQLLTLQGQTVHSQTLTRGENRIACRPLPPGTYLCKVVTPQFTETKKIVIR